MSDPDTALHPMVAVDDWIDHGSLLLGALWDQLDDVDTPGLLALLRAVTGPEGLQAALQQLTRKVEAVLGARHGRGPVMEGDVPLCDVQRTAGSTKWKVDEALPVLLARSRDERLKRLDEETGEVEWLEDEYACAFRVFKECCAVSYLRVGALQERGLDPDEYRERGNWRWTVKLP